MPKKKTVKRTVWQKHHILYLDRHGKDWVVRVRRSVHYLITKAQRYTRGLTPDEKTALIEAIEQLPTVAEEDL